MSRVDPESAAEAYVRLIGYAGATGAHMHICHFNSSSKTDIERCAALIRKAQAQGLPITVEAYPYGAGSTVLAAAFFSDPEFEARNGMMQILPFVDRQALVAYRQFERGIYHALGKA